MKQNKFSYSKINTYDSCGWKYYLTYKEGHYIFTDNISTTFGSLVHYIEESIGRVLQAGKEVNYEQ